MLAVKNRMVRNPKLLELHRCREIKINLLSQFIGPLPARLTFSEVARRNPEALDVTILFEDRCFVGRSVTLNAFNTRFEIRKRSRHTPPAHQSNTFPLPSPEGSDPHQPVVGHRRDSRRSRHRAEDSHIRGRQPGDFAALPISTSQTDVCPASI